MKLGKLFKGVIEITTLPVAVAADVLSMGVSKAVDDEFLTEKLLNKIEEDLDEVL